MTVPYVADTDWVVHYLNGHAGIIEKLTSLRKDGLGISVVSLAELYEGVYHSTNPVGNENALVDFLTGVSVLPIDEAVCKLFGKERGRLRQQRKMIGDMDLLIASSCLRYDATLLTNNRRHFQAVEGLNIVSI